MSSTGTRKPRDVNSRAAEAIIENDKELINSFKIFAEASNSTAGLAGPAVNNSPKTPAGNYIAREGDSMIGPLALGPPVDFRIEVDANNTIDVGPLNENVQYTSNVQLDDLQPNSAVLDIIANAAFDGQILVLRTFAPTIPYTVSQGTLGNGGNIQTPDGNDVTFGDLQMMVLIFDASLIINANTGGTWRVLPGVGAGAATTPITTWKLPARAKSTIDVPNLAAALVDVDGVTLIQGDRILLTDQTILSENGLYIVGVVAAGLAPLTRPADFDTDDKVLSETFVAIEEGTQFKNQSWHLISNNPILIDVTNQVWSQFAPGTSGGPDLGGGEDGIDAAGQWVYDGRTATGIQITKRWEKGTNGTQADAGVNDVIWLPSIANLRGRLVAVGNSTLTNPVGYSNDMGDSWLTSGLSGNHDWVRSAYDPVGNILITVNTSASTTTTTMARSTDRAVSYGNVTLPNTDNHWDVIWSPTDSLFVATAFSTPFGPGQIRGIITSPDGASGNWTARVTPIPLSNPFTFWRYVAYSTVLGLYICTTGGNNDVMTSPDAITWTAHLTNISLSNHLRLIYSEGQNKFVAVGSFGSATLISWTSTDGINWKQFTIDTLPTVASIQDVFWAPDLSMYVAVGGSTGVGFNAAPKIWTSPDAEVWTRVPIGIEYTDFSTHQAITYAQEYGQFVAVTGTSGIIIYRTFR